MGISRREALEIADFRTGESRSSLVEVADRDIKNSSLSTSDAKGCGFLEGKRDHHGPCDAGNDAYGEVDPACPVPGPGGLGCCC
jgi:hypothetical protein